MATNRNQLILLSLAMLLLIGMVMLNYYITEASQTVSQPEIHETGNEEVAAKIEVARSHNDGPPPVEEIQEQTPPPGDEDAENLAREPAANNTGSVPPAPAKDSEATAPSAKPDSQDDLEKNNKDEQQTAPVEKPDPAPAPPAPEKRGSAPVNFNDLVLGVIQSYNSGSYPYLLNTDYRNYNGVTTNLYYQGKLLAKAHPTGNRASHCSGITFEVFFKAMQEWNRLQGLPQDSFKNLNFWQIQDFMLTWYVGNGPKSVSNLAVAVEKYSLGKRIYNWEEARPGDFLDFSRKNGTGHSVVFIDWVRSNGNIVGIKYWSSQGSTGGIAYNTEYFTDYGGQVLTSPVYIARVLP